MAASDHKTAITVAIISVVGSLGVALITTWEKNEAGPADSIAPHAPAIEVSPHIEVMEERLKQLRLGPGEEKLIKGEDLYTRIATYPEPSCVGPLTIPFTWQVRLPYPRGGDLEIRTVHQGGHTSTVGRGSMGWGTMNICSEYTFRNNDVEEILVELRYANAWDRNR